jgi:hypothetical protein
MAHIRARTTYSNSDRPSRALFFAPNVSCGQSDTIQPNSRRGRLILNSGLDGSATVRQHQSSTNAPHQSVHSIRRGEKWRDGYVGAQGTDDAQISVWVCAETHEAPYELVASRSNDQLMLDCSAGNSSGDTVGASSGPKAFEASSESRLRNDLWCAFSATGAGVIP